MNIQIIFNEAKKFNDTHSNNKGYNTYYEYKHKAELMINKATVTFTVIEEYSEFHFETYLEGGFFKTQYAKARIVDKIRPDKLALKVRTEYGFYGRTNFRYDTFIDFNKYYCISKMYQILDKAEFEYISFFGYEVCFIKQCYDKNSSILSNIFTNEVDEMKYDETMFIVG